MWVLCLQVFAVAFGIGMTHPVTGVHAHDLGGGALGFGLATASFFLGRLVFTPVIGRLSDIQGRKRYLFAGFALMTVSGLLLISARGLVVLAVARFLQGSAAAFAIPVLMASAGVISPSSSVGGRMGVFNGLRSAGFALGFLAGVMALMLTGRPQLVTYLIVVGTGLVGLAVLPAVPGRAAGTEVRTPVRYAALFRDRLVRRLAFYRLFLSMATPAFMIFLPVLARGAQEGDIEPGGAGAIGAVAELPPVWLAVLAAMGMAGCVLQMALGRLLDRLGTRAKAAAAIAGAAAIAVTFVLLPQLRALQGSTLLVVLSVLSGLSGLGVGALILPGVMLTVETGRARGMGSVVGATEFAVPVGNALGVGAASYAVSLSPSYLFPVVAVFPVVASVFYALALAALD